ncbi:hypothetical protein AB395_00003358 [Sinorhizobium fredii CCBAU 45436]|nr:hypothetical protein AB395_00003358 [Sinorhizobium fredii CCBAU 45436]
MIKVEWTPDIEQRLMESVYLAFDEFLNEWRTFMTADYEDGFAALELIDQALAKLIGDSFHVVAETEAGEEWEDDYDPPFHDEESAFKWLQSSIFEEHDTWPTSEFFDSDNLDREVHHLWLARGFLAAKLDRIYGSMRLNEKEPLTPRVYTKSKLNDDIQQLVSDLCRAWTCFDPDLGWQRTGEGRTNPLLRFIVAGVTIATGDDWSEGKWLKRLENFVGSHIRRDIRMEQAELPFSREEPPYTGDGDPFDLDNEDGDGDVVIQLNPRR